MHFSRTRASNRYLPGDELKASIVRLKELTHALSNLVGLTMNHLQLCSRGMANGPGPLRDHFLNAEKLSTMATDHLKCLMNEVSYLHAITNGPGNARKREKSV